MLARPGQCRLAQGILKRHVLTPGSAPERLVFLARKGYLDPANAGLNWFHDMESWGLFMIKGFRETRKGLHFPYEILIKVRRAIGA